MQKDLGELIRTIDGHPDPYTKISKKDFQAIVSEVEQAISVEMDEIEFFKQLSRIISSIKDGHSSLQPNNGWYKQILKEHGVFPYDVYLTNENKLYVVKSYGDDQIPMGSEILEINGMTINKFIEEIEPLIYYETIAYRNDRISESFIFLLYMTFKKCDNLKIKYTYLKEEEVVVPAMDYKEWRKLKKDFKEERDSKIARGTPYDFEIIKPGVAKIDIFSFSVSRMDSYNSFLNKTFREIRENNIHSLIIDVRGNYGGWPKVASELFHYIHDGYFKTMAQSSMKISQPYRNYYFERNPHLRTHKHVFVKRSHYVDVHEVINGVIDEYVYEDAFFNEEPSTEKYEFTGDCYLLIDRKSYSASSSFASTFQCYSMGFLVGEPTGGTKVYRANNFYKQLTRSGFYVMISSTKLFSSCYSDEDEPVIPNVEVVPSILDIVNDVDKQLDTALLLIDKIQKQKADEEKE